MNQPLVEVRDLVKCYKIPSALPFVPAGQVHAVDHVSFSIESGKTLGLVGETGCGKSSIGRIIVGLEQPDSGSVFYCGQKISGSGQKQLRSVRTQLQMVFQDAYSSLNPRKHIRSILAEPMLYHGICSPDTVDARIDELLDLVGLPKNTKGRYPHEFSGGQRQRICIAQALSLNPRFLVCDEPVSALDVSIQAQILNLLSGLQRELGISLLFIGHGLATVKYISHDIAVMYMGQLVEVADAAVLFQRPQHPYTKALIAAAPVANPDADSFSGGILQGEVGSNSNPPTGCRFHPRCPLCMEQCRKEAPKQTETEPGHLVACHCFGTKEKNG